MDLVVIAHNIRSTHNVGAIFRTADGFGITKVYTSGYTPYPEIANDSRLPHLRQKTTEQISKTALGAEKSVPHEYYEDILGLLHQLKSEGYRVVALEQHAHSQPLNCYNPSIKCALLLGEEVNGIEAELLKHCDDIVEIPMRGRKESFNVSVAAGIAMYALTENIVK